MEFPSLPALHEVAGDLDALAERMTGLARMDDQPFPSGDIRSIGKIVTSRKKLTRRLLKLVAADFNTYFMEIGGSCRWGNRIKEWPQEKRLRALYYLQWDFFERFPKYTPLMRWVTEAQTPALYRALALHNEMRLTVLMFLNLLEQQQVVTDPADAT